MIRNRSAEVKTPNEQTRMTKYFSANKNNINRLAQAFKNDDINTMREILYENSENSFIGKLYSIYDAEFKESIVKTILRKNSSMIEDKDYLTKGKYEPRYKISDRVQKFKKKLPKKRIKQKSRKGKTYKRSKPKRFSKREIQFLRFNKQVKNKELVNRFNKLFPNRSKSSIVSKKYRVKW